MNTLYSQWKKEEQAPFSGWDFSYIKKRIKKEHPSWNYKKRARALIKKAESVLDMGTGGGEFFSTLAPFPKHTIATETWPPNVPIAKKRLKPLGVEVIKINSQKRLPFHDEEFDLVLNHHSAYDATEVFRITKKGGVFLTQQVAGDNLKDLKKEFNAKPKFKNWKLKKAKRELENVGFKIKEAKKWSGKIEFKDVGAIVYYLKAIPWLVENFSVDNHLSVLKKLQKRIDKGEKLIFTETRFFILAEKINS